jgi:nicotinic acid mononucleotide adenylyltransferase
MKKTVNIWFGGSYSPPTKAHFECLKAMVEKVKELMAEGQLSTGDINAVFVPVPQEYGKISVTNRVLPDSNIHRVKMLELGIAESLPSTKFDIGSETYNVTFGISDFEIKLGAERGVGIATWESLQQFGEDSITVFGQGYDNLEAILQGKWSRPDVLLSYTILAVQRGGLTKPENQNANASTGLIAGIGNVARLKTKIDVAAIDAKSEKKFGTKEAVIEAITTNFKNTELAPEVAAGLSEASSSTFRALLRAYRVVDEAKKTEIMTQLKEMAYDSIVKYCIDNDLYKNKVDGLFDMETNPGTVLVASSDKLYGDAKKEVDNFNAEFGTAGGRRRTLCKKGKNTKKTKKAKKLRSRRNRL